MSHQRHLALWTSLCFAVAAFLGATGALAIEKPPAPPELTLKSATIVGGPSGGFEFTGGLTLSSIGDAKEVTFAFGTTPMFPRGSETIPIAKFTRTGNVLHYTAPALNLDLDFDLKTFSAKGPFGASELVQFLTSRTIATKLEIGTWRRCNLATGLSGGMGKTGDMIVQYHQMVDSLTGVLAQVDCRQPRVDFSAERHAPAGQESKVPLTTTLYLDPSLDPASVVVKMRPKGEPAQMAANEKQLCLLKTAPMSKNVFECEAAVNVPTPGHWVLLFQATYGGETFTTYRALEIDATLSASEGQDVAPVPCKNPRALPEELVMAGVAPKAKLTVTGCSPLVLELVLCDSSTFIGKSELVPMVCTPKGDGSDPTPQECAAESRMHKDSTIYLNDLVAPSLGQATCKVRDESADPLGTTLVWGAFYRKLPETACGGANRAMCFEFGDCVVPLLKKRALAQMSCLYDVARGMCPSAKDCVADSGVHMAAAPMSPEMMSKLKSKLKAQMEAAMKVPPFMPSGASAKP